MLSLLSQNIFTIRSVFAAAHAIKNKLSITEAYIIVLLFEHPISRKALFNSVKRDRSTIQHTLSELKQKKLIAETADGTLALTHAGVSIYAEIINIIVDSSRKSSTAP